MVLTTRVLPPAEWHRLAVTNLPALLQYAIPGDTEVTVVEDEGRIVGSIAVLRVVHVEGLWIAPERRGRVAVMRLLVASMYASARRFAPSWALAAAACGQMRGLLSRHLGAVPVPIDVFALPLPKESECRHSS